MIDKLLTRLRRRLADQEGSLPQRLQASASAAARYASGLVRGTVVLRDCDQVGKLVRTPGGSPHIDNRGRIELGSGVVLTSRFCPVRLATGPDGAIRIGERCHINFGVTIAANRSIVLGSNVSVGPYAVIADSPYEGAPATAFESEPIEIGDGVWLAGRVTVLPGTRIGAGSVITAGSIVSGEIPPRVIAGGIPARVLRSLDEGDRLTMIARGVPANNTQSLAPNVPPSAALRLAPLKMPELSELVIPSMVPGQRLSLSPPAPSHRPPEYRAWVISDFTIQEFGNLLSQDQQAPTLAVEVAPYQPIAQTLLTQADTPADLVIVWGLAENCVPSFQRVLAYEAVAQQMLDTEVDAYASLVGRTLAGYKCVVVPTWTTPAHHRGLGVADLRPGGVAHALHGMNQRLIEALNRYSNVHVLDAQRWLSTVGGNAQHPKLWYLGKMAYTRDVFEEAVLDVKAALAAVTGRARKLVVVDLDDTMWGGVVGDVGWESLRLGGHDSQGEAFVDFQRALKNLTRRGILLAIASKNEESVALEAIRKHSEMVLREEDFAGWRINWQDKARNIADLAKELNLGLQSVVFIDDNPVERGRVKEALPEVLVPEWPEDKHLYASTLLGLRCFDSGQLSAEDQQRTKMMRDQRQRQQNAPNLGSLEEWIESLQMQVKAELLSPNNLPRTAQLLNKTNQMNLSTRRLTEAELTAWVSAGQRELWVVNVADRFGDSGLTGIVSIEAEGDTGRIVDYLLSCRVMGRNVEELLLHIAVYAARQRGLRTLQARLVPTAKNKPCLDFMLRSGFNQTGEHEFEWDLSREYPAPRAVALNLAAGAAA